MLSRFAPNGIVPLRQLAHFSKVDAVLYVKKFDLYLNIFH